MNSREEFNHNTSVEVYGGLNDKGPVYYLFNRVWKCLFWPCCAAGEGRSTFIGNMAENEIITMQGASPLASPSGRLLYFSYFTSISSHFDLCSLLFLLLLLVSLSLLSSPSPSPSPSSSSSLLSLSGCVCVSISRSPVTNQGDGCQGRCAACLPKIIPLNSGI